MWWSERGRGSEAVMAGAAREMGGGAGGAAPRKTPGARQALPSRKGGYSLVELAAVVAIVAVVAGMAVAKVSGMQREAERRAAAAEMGVLKEAFARLAADMEGVPRWCPVNPFCGEDRYEALNLRVHRLFSPGNVQGADFLAKWESSGAQHDRAYDRHVPGEGRGWNGPYVTGARTAEWPADGWRRFAGDATFAERGFVREGRQGWTNEEGRAEWTTVAARYGWTNETALLDPWGNPYVVQFPACESFEGAPASDGRVHRDFAERRRRYGRIVSAGPDGELSTPPDPLAGRSRRGASARRDDLVLFLEREDVWEENP